MGAVGAPDDEAQATRAARELGARWVITGGYQRLADIVRVTARVTEVETGTVVHTAKVDGRMGEIFELQDRLVTRALVGPAPQPRPHGPRAARRRTSSRPTRPSPRAC